MIQSTDFISQRTVESIRNAPKAVSQQRILISITGPVGERSPINNTSQLADLDPRAWKDVMRLQFHDATRKPEKDDKILFDEAMALSILKFLKKNEDLVTEAIAQCEAGISRSAAVSKFIAQIYQLPFPEGYAHYNRHVFETLYKLYEKCAYGEGPIPVDELPGVYHKKFTA